MCPIFMCTQAHSHHTQITQLILSYYIRNYAQYQEYTFDSDSSDPSSESQDRIALGIIDTNAILGVLFNCEQ